MQKHKGLFLILFLFITYGYSQKPFFQNYLLLKKNEPVNVNRILQDKNGFIWHGTNKGLFKFDGINHRRFTMTEGLPHDNITAMAEDSTGKLWLGHKNGSVAYIEKDSITSFDPSKNIKGAISDMLFDTKGNLWFSTFNDGLYYFTGEKLYRLDENDGMPDIFIYDILEDKHGNIWAGTDGGIAICTIINKKATVRTVNYAKGLPDNIIKKLVQGKNDTIWIATEDAGIVNYDPVSDKYQRLDGPIIKHSITDFILKENKIWIASQAGLGVYERNSRRIKTYDNASLLSNTINTLLLDKEGNIWAGSKSGVIRTPGDHIEYLDKLGLTDMNILAVASHHNGDIWFAGSEGLFKTSMDASGKAYTSKQLINTRFEKQTIISLYIDPSGFVWAGLYGEGALRINPVTDKIRHLKKELRNGNVLNITGKDHHVWLATLGGSTQINFSGDKLDITNYGTTDGLASDYIYQVFIDGKDRVWFATDGKGVTMKDANGFHHYQTGLNSKVVYGFAEDRDQKIWVNTQGDGLYKFDGNKFHQVASNLRFRDNNISCFSADDKGNLVIMHDEGIDVYEPATNKIYFFGDEAGIIEKRPNLNAVAKTSDGHFLLGTDAGIINFTFVPLEMKAVPEPFIESIKILDRKVDAVQNLRLNYNENYITFNFSGFWYQNPLALDFQYKLENYDREWMTSENRMATYSRLPPGKYIFRLKVSDKGNFSESKEATLTFEIKSPFWATPWFYLLCILSGAFLIYNFIRYREKMLLKEKLILEIKVRERTIALQQRTEEVQMQNEEIQSQAEEIKGINENLEQIVKERTKELEKKNMALEEYSFINAHKLRGPVATILGLSYLFKNSELTDFNKELTEHLQRAVENLDSIVDSISKAIRKGDE